MKLKYFLERVVGDANVDGLELYRVLLDLESIERHFNIFYGIEFDINIKVAKPRPSRFIGERVIDELEKVRNLKKK